MAQLYFRYGTMNSGKSMDLLKMAHNYEEQDKKVLLFSPAVDDRYGSGVVGSRVGLRKPAIRVEEHTDLLDIVRSEIPSCVLVDEAQFLKKDHVLQLSEIVDTLGISVFAYGLRADFQGQLFPGSRELLALADEIEEVRTVCWYCEKKAIMNMRLKNGMPVFEGEQIQIGGNESYLPVCRRCYSARKKLLLRDSHPEGNPAGLR
ncbi:thymidine kinase [Paenibacillus sp. y28]|uniref:thymidine kinase n=1 Tax=Paenibacillus sp. y28 TaxID=3129110 RepID=UPI003017BB8E